ncbi:esterase-like activity of phytase family protein [Sphingomonas sp. LY160]|uniref:esterase-like activity of phytase family protein n=1 Tax=Sphingomonas sp. LY160 TaxID=3095342 RepID=UPI002ADEDB42|nr:esterase-like activity of phytase family protein [Sphingomonas sp. LY160]MEA1072633.1 esterase-like activity of phytase family protein [Sphingomonas sp. LY160]
MKSPLFNGLFLGALVWLVSLPIRDMPDRHPRPPRVVPVSYEAVRLADREGPLRVAGAWRMTGPDVRLGGLSALAIRKKRFVVVSDLGGVAAIDPPSMTEPKAAVRDLTDGPGDPAYKVSRDAESLLPVPGGWIVGFEQFHSLWRFDEAFTRGSEVVDLGVNGWRRNRGAEGLIDRGDRIVALAENGRVLVEVRGGRTRSLSLDGRMEVADAATAPDGSMWLLLRGKGLKGVHQAVAELRASETGYAVGPLTALPGGPSDNFEGMQIVPRRGGGWRIWLVSDDGHRVLARTLLVALDWARPPATTNARREGRAS